jgi:hypothetical protein
MRRVSVSILFPILFTLGCSNGTSSTNDMGGNKDLSMGGDMAMMPTPDMAMANIPGTQIVKGKGIQVLNVTDDDFVGYFDAMGNVAATSLAGGMAQSVVASAGIAGVSGKTVFAWANYDTMTMIGDLTVWNSTGGANMIASNSVSNGFIVSDDGQFVVCTQNAAGDGSTADLILVKSDGTGAKTLWTGVATTMTNQPYMRYAGGKFFIAHTAAGKTAVDVVATDGTITNLSMDAKVFVANDKAGMKAMWADSSGAVSIATIGAPSSPAAMMFQGGFLLPDGSAGLMTTTGGALQRVVGGSPATTLVATMANGFPVFGDEHSLSPDGKFVLYYNSQDMNGVGDLSISSTTAANMTTVLTSKADGAIFGDPFTTDGSRVLFYTSVATGVGDFKSVDLAGGTPNTHGTNVWVSYNTSKPKGAIFNDNWKTGGMTSNGRADIKVLDDSSTTNPPTLIVASAEADFYLSHDHSKLVYVYFATVGKEGVYVTPLP